MMQAQTAYTLALLCLSAAADERVVWEGGKARAALVAGEISGPVSDVVERTCWWCWGDPIRDGATAQHPLVLRWHTTVQMSEYHGSTQPPQPAEAALSGFATSYDPGMGYGNRWNGRGYGIGSGVDHAREFHPHTIPYFAHQYRFRERAWDVHITDERFAARLARRLFDADVPAEAIEHYLSLCRLCAAPEQAGETVLAPIAAFAGARARRGTPRNRDTLLRMQEAIAGLRKLQRGK